MQPKNQAAAPDAASQPLLYGTPPAADAGEPVTLDEHAMNRRLAAQLPQASAAGGAAARVGAVAPAATRPAGPRAQGARELPLARQQMLAALDAQALARGKARDLEATTLQTGQAGSPEDASLSMSIHIATADDIDPALARELADAGKRRRPAPGTPGSDPAPPPAGRPPRTVGAYRIHRRLGRGGMGTVYRALDPRNGREVAIKLLQPSLWEDAAARARFLREARAARSLTHPCIVAVQEVGEADGQPFLAMELVRGIALSRHLELHVQLPLRDVVSIGLQLAQALAYAHDRGVIHRDIKPGNILLLPDGRTIKVSDFGIAHIEDDVLDGGPGLLVGTPQYMSPEQTRGEDVDGRSDLFSAGVVLYQMLAGERPFRGENLLALAQRIATEDPPPLVQRRPDVPPALRRAVERCLAKEPADRFASGHELAQVLSDVLAELELAERQSRQRRVWSLGLRWAAQLGLATALAFAVGAVIWSARLLDSQWQLAADHGQRSAQSLAAQLAPVALEGDWDTASVLLQHAAGVSGWRSVKVFDDQGVLRAGAGAGAAAGAVQPAVPGPSDVTAGRSSLPVGAAPARIDLATGGQALLVRVPLLQQGKQLGQLELVADAEPWLTPWHRSLPGLAVLGAVVVAFASITAWALATRLGRQLRALADALDAQALGRWNAVTQQLDGGRRDEVGLVHQSFDAMARSLWRRGDPR